MEKKVFSPTGNRTPVSRVTGGDTNHYTIEDMCVLSQSFSEQGELEFLQFHQIVEEHTY